MPGNPEPNPAAWPARDAVQAAPRVLVAELTHRCPLGCPYCCNPLALEPREDELDAATWARVFAEAAALGVAQVRLSGGEPGMRRDLVDIAAHAREAGLATTLVTSGVGIATRTLRDLWEAGLDRVEVSFQDADAVTADRIAGSRGAFQRKFALATEAVRLGLPLTVGVVVHRANIERIGAMVELALRLKAERVEFTWVQYRGWALKNRAALTPRPDRVARAVAEVEALRQAHRGRIAIDVSAPDRRAHGSGSFTEGAGCCSLAVTPSGRVLPFEAADCVPGLEFCNVRDRSLAEIRTRSPAFAAFRGVGCQAREAAPAGVPDDAPYAYRRM
jgi:pyrroloquinoline quinone biosynthesis protein E